MQSLAPCFVVMLALLLTSATLRFCKNFAYKRRVRRRLMEACFSSNFQVSNAPVQLASAREVKSALRLGA